MKHKYTSTDLTEHQIQACVMAWMKRHGITTSYDPFCETWMAETIHSNVKSAVHIEEDGALSNIAAKLGIPLWNEEQFLNNKDNK